jgi:hypothetical protein
VHGENYISAATATEMFTLHLVTQALDRETVRLLLSPKLQSVDGKRPERKTMKLIAIAPLLLCAGLSTLSAHASAAQPWHETMLLAAHDKDNQAEQRDSRDNRQQDSRREREVRQERDQGYGYGYERRQRENNGERERNNR